MMTSYLNSMLTDLLRIYEYLELLIALAAFVIHSVTAFRTIRSFENGAPDAVSSIGPQPPILLSHAISTLSSTSSTCQKVEP